MRDLKTLSVYRSINYNNIPKPACFLECFSLLYNNIYYNILKIATFWNVFIMYYKSISYDFRAKKTFQNYDFCWNVKIFSIIRYIIYIIDIINKH